jgi:NAD(P)-dependent dehydrogenase (short-subunit alcohol dehydrogenase family)
MTARLALITGGTGSLGYRTAELLARARWTVIITGRAALGTTAAAQRIAAGTGAEVIGLPLDLTSLDQVRRFAADLAGRGLPALDAIVCNAGIQIVSGDSRTRDGLETTFVVNHLAQFLLVRLLLPSMSQAGRIVLVASGTHDPARHTGMPAPRYTQARALAYPEPAGRDDAALVGRRRYTTSKLCNVLTAYELSRRLAAGELGSPGVTVNAFDPGLMPGTGLARDYSGFQAFAWRYLLPALTGLPGLNVHTPRRSARALARLITDPELEGVSGQYFSGFHRTRSSTESYDRSMAAQLWAASAELAGLGGQQIRPPSVPK